jgi:chitin disaccharide deacetylase
VSGASLAERLGYSPNDKLLIVNADDLGSCHSANVSVFECLHTGLVTSATLMVPCPWAREASARYRGEDVGVHLTLNAEHELYRWGPITFAPSLLGGDGGFPRTMEDVWDHADLDEVRRECRAQIERAILWGFDVSHLDAHMATLQLRPEFFDVYLDLAVEFRLPLRMFGASMEHYLGFPARQVASDAGVIFTDHMIFVPGVGSRQSFESHVANLRPGVTEMHVHPAVDSAELRSLATDWEARVDDHRMICQEDWLRQAIDEAGITLIGYRPLRELARSAR